MRTDFILFKSDKDTISMQKYLDEAGNKSVNQEKKYLVSPFDIDMGLKTGGEYIPGTDTRVALPVQLDFPIRDNRCALTGSAAVNKLFAESDVMIVHAEPVTVKKSDGTTMFSIDNIDAVRKPTEAEIAAHKSNAEAYQQDVIAYHKDNMMCDVQSNANAYIWQPMLAIYAKSQQEIEDGLKKSDICSQDIYDAVDMQCDLMKNRNIARVCGAVIQDKGADIGRVDFSSDADMLRIENEALAINPYCKSAIDATEIYANKLSVGMQCGIDTVLDNKYWMSQPSPNDYQKGFMETAVRRAKSYGVKTGKAPAALAGAADNYRNQNTGNGSGGGDGMSL